MTGVSDVLVIVPTYQEAHSIGTLLTQVRSACDADILVVDDASPDGTAELAARCGRSLGGVHVMRRSAKLGLGSAYRAGFAWGLARGYEVLVEMDADLSHDPATLPAILEAAASADLVVGSRYVPGGSSPGWSLRRRQLSQWANRYARWMLRLPVRDATSGFRAFRADLLRQLDLVAAGSTGYAFQIEMVDLATRAGAVICEVPIRFMEREHGASKMSGRIIVEAMVSVTLSGVSRRVRFRSARVQRAATASRTAGKVA